MTNEVRTRKWMRAAQKGLKMSCIHLFGHHNWTRIILENHGFDPFLSHLWSQLAHFHGPFGLERSQNCSTWAQNGSKSNDVAKAAMNEIWGILFSLINMAGMAEPVRRQRLGLGSPSGWNQSWFYNPF